MYINFRYFSFISAFVLSLFIGGNLLAENNFDHVEIKMEKGDNFFQIFSKMKINYSEAQIFIKSLKRRLDLHRIPIGQKIDFYFQHNTKNILVVSVPLKRNITVLAWKEKKRVNSIRISDSMVMDRIEAIFNMENFRPKPGKYFIKVKKGDNLTKILSYYGADLDEVHSIIVAFSSVKNLKKLKPDDEITMYYFSGEDGVFLEKLEIIMSGEKFLVRKDAFKIFRVGTEPTEITEDEDGKLLKEYDLSKGDTILGQLKDAGWTKKEAREAVNAIATVYDPRKIKIGSKIIFPKDLRIRAFAFGITSRLSILVTSIGRGKFLAKKESLQSARALVASLKYAEILQEKLDVVIREKDEIKSREKSIETEEIGKKLEEIVDKDDLEDFYLSTNLVEGKILRGDSLLARLYALGEKKKTIKKAIESLEKVTDPNFIKSGSDFIVALGKDKQSMKGFYVSQTKNKGFLVKLLKDNRYKADKMSKKEAISILLEMKIQIAKIDRKEEIKWHEKSLLAGKDYRVLNFTFKSGQTLSHLFSKVNIPERDTIGFIKTLKTIYNPKNFHVGQEVKIALNNEDPEELLGLIISLDKIRSIEIFYLKEKYKINRYKKNTFTKYHKNLGEIDNSLYMAAKDVGMPIPVLMQLVKIFSFDVDFQREVKKGDAFEVIYEKRYISEEESVDSGTVLRAVLILGGERITLYRFDDKYNGISDYFDSEGHSVRKALMRTPIDGARLTSGFGKRKHPILGYTKMHRGVDFGAHRNTPVYAAGDGVIEFVGSNGGYGKYILIRHNSDYKTAYAHLARFAKFLKLRKRVKQGDIIGYVGSTGRSTGPHLHYEIIFRSRQVNPLTVRLPQGIKLTGTLYKDFSETRDKLDKLWSEL
ncbi:MAG: Murein DD-endopeptidase MepM [Alphaproteobacteria bacterium MarineAlpha9_Bin2]|nr:MAG: Murein DD-endopeptidase MepM [Alphaproteobacteria bacterium MarineAlpha9_Bin2]